MIVNPQHNDIVTLNFNVKELTEKVFLKIIAHRENNVDIIEKILTASLLQNPEFTKYYQLKKMFAPDNTSSIEQEALNIVRYRIEENRRKESYKLAYDYIYNRIIDAIQSGEMFDDFINKIIFESTSGERL